MLTDAGIEVTARSGTADELLARVAEFPPDAVVVNIRLRPLTPAKECEPP